MLAETYSCSCIMLEFFSEIILQLAGREQKNQKWILCYGDKWNLCDGKSNHHLIYPKVRTISRCCLDFLFQSLIIDTVFLCPFFVWSHLYNILLSFELRRISKDLKYVFNQKKMSKHNWSHFFKGEGKKTKIHHCILINILGWY